MRFAEAEHIARIFDDCYLHAKTNTEVGNLVNSCIIGRSNFAFDTPAAKATGNQNSIQIFETLYAIRFDEVGIDFNYINPCFGMDAGVIERLIQ